ncbi:MAG: hypothetical protein RML40_06715 [Bacteroidota bacterium]|nr:hypothetical protein [Candidatus Kapabacteria bacterium]MDW8220208.1 hypothetical protein [Bacteroidota bacterium]
MTTMTTIIYTCRIIAFVLRIVITAMMLGTMLTTVVRACSTVPNAEIYSDNVVVCGKAHYAPQTIDKSVSE